MCGVLGTAREQRPEKAVATRIEGLGNMGWWVQRPKGLPVCPRDSAEAGAEAEGAEPGRPLAGQVRALQAAQGLALPG